ncbi:MAG: hypothetical protein A3C22_00055 [Candidatus Levybacteria bacterium RIFCSPHIGHO2_02_FULL_37_10]|nr:MAG: hypothetical protein A3C22_00055 [Candidatus Levybacteria bacterium RIFCSPHIGHO2_02_FULL_37_10]OGH42485.1 MAG: hypothetical protein A3H79_01405 [Candidatus Levybacteria bacterium RIFCSPLOWO2_02_FULL_36_8b]
MRIEVDCHSQDKRSSILVKSHTVNPNDIGNIDFLGPETRIVVFGDVDGSSGRVMISGKDKGVEVVLYEDEKDMDGKKVHAKRPIQISGHQELSISRNRDKFTKEVVIFVDSSDDNNTDEPQGDPLEKLSLGLPHSQTNVLTHVS